MTDYKRGVPCERKEKMNWKDFLPTALMIASVLILFALATHELVKEGGALDFALGLTSIESAK